MKRYIPAVLAVLICQFAWAQQPIKNLEPVNVSLLNLSAEGERQFLEDQKMIKQIMEKLEHGMKLEDLPTAQQELYNEYDETDEDYWEILGAGCSWYCGGSYEDVTASSSLKSQGDNSYDAANASDLNYKTAWVEGVAGDGIGQYLLYKFPAENPRITNIIVVNGYVKSQAAWENNARPKKLKLYVNDRPYAILNLMDQRAAQHFKVDPIGYGDRHDFANLKNKHPWLLKFEILEVYKGFKYDDVAISEIYFDGMDVHCLAKGTPVSIGHGQTKNIEALVPGDSVLSFDRETSRTRIVAVQDVAKAMHHDLVRYTFDDGREIVATQDHPFLVHGKGWASLNPTHSSQYKGFEDIATIKLGDAFETFDTQGNRQIVVLHEIEHLDGHVETYTITRLSSGNNFLAKGCVVGVEDTGNAMVIGNAQVKR